MDFKHDPIQTLTIPETAGPGQERLVITTTLPPPLDTYTWGSVNQYAYYAALIWYAGGGDDSTYNYIAGVTDSTSIFPGVILHVGGQVLSGGVVANLDGTPKCSEYHMLPSGGDQHYLRADEIHIQNDLDPLAAVGSINLETNGAVNVDAHTNITLDADNGVFLKGRGGFGIQVTNTFSFNLQGVNPFRMYKVNGDANATLEISNNAEIRFGAGGGSALDNTFKRLSANLFESNSTIQVLRGLLTDFTFATKWTGDADSRHAVYADGKHEWGDGTATPKDTNLYRGNTASVLQTDDRISQREMTAIYARLAAAPIGSGAANFVGTYDTTVADFWGIGNIAGTFTIPAGFDGKWTIESNVQFSLVAAPAGIRLIQLRKNTVPFAESRPGTNVVGGQPTSLTICQSDVFAVGDTLDVCLFHSQGVALNYGGVGQAQFRTTITYRGRVV